jgi:2-keto-4-pentenoate hydratase/2-oxohepta-3-ene-1,7-dioic acid hydratase in catechol pathway
VKIFSQHIAETALEKPEYPTFFSKESSCVIADGDAIHLPKVSEKLDYEVELAFVIGKACRHVPVEKAHQVIAGYTLVNDVTVRDWQFPGSHITTRLHLYTNPAGCSGRNHIAGLQGHRLT